MTRVLCAILLAALASCAKVGGGKAGDAAIGGAPGNDGAVDSGSGGNAGGTTGGADGGSCVRCSADLHDIVDCNDRVIRKCPNDQGCAAGACVPSCEAAKANNSATGCEFYSVETPGTADPLFLPGDCFAALLSNTWTTPVTIKVSLGGTPLNVAGMARTPKVGRNNVITYEPLVDDQLAPGQMAILFLAQGDRNPPQGGLVITSPPLKCPEGVQPGALNQAITGTGSGKAFLITTSGPIAAYDMFPYGGKIGYKTSATLLIPTSAWGTNYMAVEAYPLGPGQQEDTGPFVQIVATENTTKVTLAPKVAIKGGGGIAASPASQPHTYTLSKGEVLQFAQGELGGTPIASDKPIGVWAGSDGMCIPAGGDPCDTGHQQILPIKWLGSEYVAVRHRDRLLGHPEDVPWAFMGTVDGTILTYDPGPPAGAPTSLDRGKVVRFSADQPFVVRSNDDKHPFYVAGYMTSSSASPAPDLPEGGDPDFVNAVPPQQWLRSYTFLTDPTYLYSNLVFIRQKGPDMSFKDVTLDCIGAVTGWAPVGTGKQFEFARVEFDKQPNGCLDGPHSARSETPFGLTVWGWDTAVSYAYPAGLSTKPINTIVVPPVVP